jgi:hypothetical protein
LRPAGLTFDGGFPYEATGRVATIIIGAAGASSAVAADRAAAKAPPTYEQVIVRNWKGIHDKILVMAKDSVFPEAKLSYKPHPDSRTMAQELRHVTIGLQMTTGAGQGREVRLRGEGKRD